MLGTAVGYCGGTTEDPTYEMVCEGSSGHAETVEVEYDPSVVSYADLLKIFWQIHDPTQGRRQGLNIGDQYRSAIFCQDEAQLNEAHHSLQAEQAKYLKPITTEVRMVPRFWLAEQYHQQYYAKKGAASCRI